MTSATPLPGGVSSDVVLEEGPDGPIVVKRALSRLKVAADWRSDPARSLTEVAALRALAELLGQDAVPRVLWVDEAHFAFAMERIDPALLPWKTWLLAGEVDLATAARVGQLLGLMHARSQGRGDLAARFADRQFFLELRCRPYHERVAERHPDLAPIIRSVIDFMDVNRQALVHGDYSPKNLLVAGGRVVVIDCEVAHWGDPRFDVGFCLNHLLLKMIRDPGAADRLAAVAATFLDAYAAAGLPVLDAWASRQLGCLMLARVDGDSPAEYLTEPAQHDAVRAVARRLLEQAPDDPRAAIAWTREA